MKTSQCMKKRGRNKIEEIQREWKSKTEVATENKEIDSGGKYLYILFLCSCVVVIVVVYLCVCVCVCVCVSLKNVEVKKKYQNK